MAVTRADIGAKFGGDYVADDLTFKMGIDVRFTAHLARRFAGLRVLETCTGGGFTTISLAREAAHVVTVDVDPRVQDQARQNLETAGLSDRITFVSGDVMDPRIVAAHLPVDAAFLDPDWAETGSGHVFRFRASNTRPPADALLDRAMKWTANVALVLPPRIEPSELVNLVPHECQRLYLGDRHELLCLYFGCLATETGPTELRVPR